MIFLFTGNMDHDNCQVNQEAEKDKRKRHWETVLGNSAMDQATDCFANSFQKSQSSKGDALVCEECNMGFFGKSKVSNHNKHFNSVHLKNFPHRCPRCPKKFQYRHKLEHHINTVHRGIKPFSCNQCGRLFSDKSNLSKHRNGRSCSKNQAKKGATSIAHLLHNDSSSP